MMPSAAFDSLVPLKWILMPEGSSNMISFRLPGKSSAVDGARCLCGTEKRTGAKASERSFSPELGKTFDVDGQNLPFQ